MPITAERFSDPRQEFRARICIMPPFAPSVSLEHDGDVGSGHTPIFYDIPLMGPNRIAIAGQPVTFSGEDSYQRGGALATGHTWYAYLIDQADPEGIDRALAGTLEAGFPVMAPTLTWTPSVPGTYRVELQLANRHTTFNTDGFRFVRVFEDDIDADLQEVTSWRGQGSVEGGGYELSLTYKPSDQSEVVLPWSRVILNIDTYWSGSLDTFDTQGITKVPSVQFNGIVVEDSISVNPETEEITFTLRTPQYTLSRVPVRGYVRTETTSIGDPPQEVSVLVEYPIFFADPTANIPLPDGTTINAVQKVHEAKADFPVHEIGTAEVVGPPAVPAVPMTLTDPLIHMLQMHLNYMKWWDVFLQQEISRYMLPVSFSMQDFWSQVKQLQEKRLGEVYCDKKGALTIQEDIRFQSDEVWTGLGVMAEMDFDADNTDSIQISESFYKVCQIKLIGVDPSYIPYFVQFPIYADFIGEPVQRTALLAPSKAVLEQWAQRMYTVFNQPYAATVKVHGLNRSLELNDVVGINYTDPAGKVTL